MSRLVRLRFVLIGGITAAGMFLFLEKYSEIYQIALIILIGGGISVYFFWQALSFDQVKIDDLGILISTENKMYFWKDIKYAYIERVKSGKNSIKHLTIIGTENESYNVEVMDINEAKMRKIVKECTGKNIGSKIYKRNDETFAEWATEKRLNEAEREEAKEKRDRIVELFITLKEKIESKIVPTFVLSFILTILVIISQKSFLEHCRDITASTHIYMPTVVAFSIFLIYKCVIEGNFYNLPQIKALKKDELEMYENIVYEHKKSPTLYYVLTIIATGVSIAYIVYYIICLLS